MVSNKRESGRPAAVFLDRDGVINDLIEGSYVLRWEEFRFRPGALSALRLLADASIPAVVVTNQSCVSRGLIAAELLDEIHHRLLVAVQEYGGALARIEICPHHPDAGCSCRKPQPGLLLRAAEALNVELAEVVAVGDSESDLAAAATAGCRVFYWVGAPADAEAVATRFKGIAIVGVASLWEAARRIVGIEEP